MSDAVVFNFISSPQYSRFHEYNYRSTESLKKNYIRTRATRRDTELKGVGNASVAISQQQLMHILHN